jgi:hypothetical protein
MQHVNWFRRIVFAVALWLFAVGFSTRVADSLKRALSPDESYRLDCRWVPRSDPFKDTADDSVSRVWGRYYSVAAAGILLVMWAVWKTLTPKPPGGNQKHEWPHEEHRADGGQVGAVPVRPRGDPPGGGKTP